MSERSKRLRRSLPLLASLSLVALGCDDPLTDPALIVGPRIVGARVESEADPTVAEPVPGEGASIDWLVLAPELETFTARAVWCNAAPTVIGAPRCASAAFAERTVSGSWGVPLRLDFTVPSDLEPGAAWLAWLGICAQGEAVFEASESRFRCADGDALSAFYRGYVPEGAPNHNPSLADDSLTLDGVPWLSAEVPLGSPCAGLGLPELLPEQRASIGLELGGDDREALDSEPGTYAAHPRESLVFTHLATLPGLDRAFSAIDYDATRLGFEVPYEYAGAELDPDGTTAGFYLFVRDERGGVDWIERRACLLAP